MKKMHLILAASLALGTAALIASPSGWETPKAGPYLSLGGGGEFRGSALVGKGETALTSFKFGQPCITDVNVARFDLMKLSSVTYTAMAVSRCAESAQNVSTVVGVVLLPPGVTSASAGATIQVSNAGSITPVRVSYPVAVSKGDLLVASGTAGELTVTSNTSLTATAAIVNFQALETKTTSSTDQFVMARQLR